MKQRLAQEWTRERDLYWWRFTWARENYTRWNWYAGITSAGDDDYNRSNCYLRFTGFGRSLLITVPHVIKPHCRRIHPAGWDDATVKRLGRDYYDILTPREYSVSLHDGSHLSIYYGIHSNDSRTEQQWGCFLPWTQWRHVRHDLYDLDGKLFAEMPEHHKMMDTWGWREAIKKACAVAVFDFLDFDGEPLYVKTCIEEREWLKGTGWFKWLSWFSKPKVSRLLDLNFSGEVGGDRPERKGSWKGGTLGHAIEMLPGELHEAAFRRYCDAYNMTFVGTHGDLVECPFCGSGKVVLVPDGSGKHKCTTKRCNATWTPPAPMIDEQRAVVDGSSS
jgi:hypothetical protein